MLELILHGIVDSILLWTGYVFGMSGGALAGVLCGMGMAFYYHNLSLIGMGAMLGVCLGGLRKLGRFVQAVAGYAVIVLLDYFFGGMSFLYHQEVSYIASVIVFLAVPLKQESFPWSRKQKDKAYIYQMANVATRDRMKDFALSFRKLEELMEHENENKWNFTQIDAKNLVEEIEGQMCTHCSRRNYCIDRDYLMTYQSTREIVCALEEGNGITLEDIPMDFSNRCIKLGEFLMTADRRVEIARMNMEWSNRLKDGRRILAGQLGELASVMERFSKDLYEEEAVADENEKKMIHAMAFAGIGVQKVIAMQGSGGRKELYMTLYSRKGNVITAREAAKILGKVQKKNMMPSEYSPLTIERETRVLSFVEEPPFAVLFGSSRYTKDGETMSGDNHTYLKNDGRVIMAIADGMGSGAQAYADSLGLIEMLEQFLEAGLPTRESVHLMNGALAVHADRNSYSTLDVMSCNLYDGTVDFIKVGSPSTFIKRGSWVEEITSESLPIGMLQITDESVTQKKLFDGDIVIMMSDGVLDAIPDLKKEEAMKQYIKSMQENNPQKIADMIMDRVLRAANKQSRDDMTIMVLSIYIP
ncbi:MAG: SpoIIE family protein phosphatase [Lachnospiraceae bacterium]